MTVKESLQELVERMQANPEPIRPLHYVYQFDLDENEPFQVHFDSGTVEVLEGTPHPADCTLKLSASNFVKLLRNDLNTTMAFMLGSLKVDGRVGLALKLQEILKAY
ncbi:hypothetical protein YDYSG_34840 [Paenibacillus tyrfis]|uniref:SCP2 sterol-binding domain-containing protein n=1 Tax=Paenibacillus tyrfis TaxID=1501230 RepID=UPI002491927A|nr:SCP2 sterol-binding domain-containing protein [Paenibacillus tyrfis]GLI07454.1 hypothetical protein YDYSG_34840 [Paenibacillus tyrfis]